MLIRRGVVGIVAVKAGADPLTGGPVSPSPRVGGVLDFSRAATARVGCGHGAVNATGGAGKVVGAVCLLNFSTGLA